MSSFLYTCMEFAKISVSVTKILDYDGIFSVRVESGSDDPDNVGHLGHFFDGSSGASTN